MNILIKYTRYNIINMRNCESYIILDYSYVVHHSLPSLFSSRIQWKIYFKNNCSHFFTTFLRLFCGYGNCLTFISKIQLCRTSGYFVNRPETGDDEQIKIINAKDLIRILNPFKIPNNPSSTNFA